tara:strand:- start:512 stop:796 length:285 start_codon:yes stop_codon:yes gene_type:complete
MITKKQINKTIADLGVELIGVSGEGTFCFVTLDFDGNYLDAEPVYVTRLSHLPLERWRVEAQSAIEEDDGFSFQQHARIDDEVENEVIVIGVGY